MKVVPLLCASLGLLGCATTAPPPTLSLNPPTPPSTEQVLVASLEPVPLPASVSEPPPLVEVPRAEALQSIARANRRALIRPRTKHFQHAMVVYDVHPGAIYTVEVGYQAFTDLVWPPGELIVAPVKGDDWFEIQQVTVGNPPQAHVLIRSNLAESSFPEQAKQSYPLTVLTNQGPYYLRLQTHDDPRYAMTGVTWKHPERLKADTMLMPPGTYHLGYALTSLHQQAPAWAPIGVWDSDLRGQTFIQFPPARRTMDAPVLFIAGPSGEKQVVNYVTRGDWYVVDQLFEQAELRVGHDDVTAQVITLKRGSHYRAIQCPGALECPWGSL
jgi:type IV secretion system protein TrbG